MSGSFGSYKLSPLAQADLEEIWLYTFKEWSREQADTYYAGFVAAFEGLALGEKIGRPVDARDGYFKCAVGSHCVFYRQSASGLEIARILHQRMDPATQL